MCSQVVELRAAFENSTDSICKITDTMQIVLESIISVEDKEDTAWVGALRLVWESLLSERDTMARVCTDSFGTKPIDESELYEASVARLLAACPFAWRA